MGGAIGRHSNGEPQSARTTRRQTIWRKKETVAQMKVRFIEDGSLPEDVSDEYVELRKILEEPVCQRFLGTFAKVSVWGSAVPRV